jgi:hypothetical protein
MNTLNAAGFAGIGLLVMGAIFSRLDLTPSRTALELMIGPVLWIAGCALMIAWAIGRVDLALSARREAEKLPYKVARKADAATSGSNKTAMARPDHRGFPRSARNLVHASVTRRHDRPSPRLRACIACLS